MANSDITILVTGATGMIGAHIALDLVRGGKKIRAIRRKNSSTRVIESIFSFYTKESAFLLSQIEWVEADLLDLGALDEALEGITHIYHAAAMVSFVPADRKKMLEVNIEGTANLVNLSLEKNIQRFCHISSIAALGRTTDGGVIDEDTWWKNSPGNSWYAISKYGAEREVWRAAEEGLNVVILNPAFVLSPGHGSSSSEVFSLLKKGFSWYTDGCTAFVDVRDVSAAAVLLTESGIRNERFILAAENLPFKTYMDSLLKELGRKPTRRKAGEFLLGLGWRAEKWLAKLSGRKPRVTKETAAASLEKNFYDGAKLCKRTGFQYRKMETSIREISAFYK